MTIKKTLSVALAAAAVAAPTAAAAPADIAPLPGAHHIPADKQDLRAPDRADWQSLPHAPLQDMRSPDAVDFAGGRTPDVTVVEIPQATGVESGFDWENAGVGAGIALGLSLLAAGGFVATGRRRSVTA